MSNQPPKTIRVRDPLTYSEERLLSSMRDYRIERAHYEAALSVSFTSFPEPVPDYAAFEERMNKNGNSWEGASWYSMADGVLQTREAALLWVNTPVLLTTSQTPVIPFIPAIPHPSDDQALAALYDQAQCLQRELAHLAALAAFKGREFYSGTFTKWVYEMTGRGWTWEDEQHRWSHTAGTVLEIKEASMLFLQGTFPNKTAANGGGLL